MSARPVPFVFALFACAIASAAADIAQPLPRSAPNGTSGPETAEQSAPIEFYLAHGAANACGSGCNEWIAAEGKIDVGAADRLRRLLPMLRDRRPPIYFRSPGGAAVGALALGQLIHDEKFEVSVGHTIPLGCGDDKQSEEACLAQKHSEMFIGAEISPTVFECNSACVYALAGGTVRLVPPWVKLGIHDAGLDPDARLPWGTSLVTKIVSWAIHLRMRSYLREMGIDDALFSATVTTPNESIAFLERDEVVRFGIDRREFGETAWQFVDRPTPKIRKRLFVRTDGDQPHYVDALIDVTCNGPSGMLVTFVRGPLEADTSSSSAGSPPMSVAIDGKEIELNRSKPLNSLVRYVGTGSVDALDKLGDEATIDVPGTALGRTERGHVTLNMDGFSAAYAKLRHNCSDATGDFTTAQARSAAVSCGCQDTP